MSFTRFNYDESRTKKLLEESTFSGRYALDTPGPGVNLAFAEDPQIRLQKWGANMMTNTVGVENDLRGMTRRLDRDNIESTYQRAPSNTVVYPSTNPFVEESRATHPAWMYKDLEHTRWEKPFLNPQANLEKNFQDNIQTRILEKDFFVPKYPTLL
jgi:hypothetical protein